MDNPVKRTVETTRHEWVVPKRFSHPITARQITDAIGVAVREMRDELSLDTSADDAWFVRAEDDDIVIYVEVSS